AGRGLGRVLGPVLAVEALHPARGIDELLLPGEERMARRADVDVDALLRGAGRDDIAAGADDVARVVAGMNAFLHGERGGVVTGGSAMCNQGAGRVRTRATASRQPR